MAETLEQTIARYRVVDFSTLNNDQLQKAVTETLVCLEKSVEVHADALDNAARGWVELIRRGLNSNTLMPPAIFWLTEIGNGKLLAEVVIRFSHNQNLVRVFSKISLDEQRERLKEGEKFPLVRRVSVNKLGTDYVKLADILIADVYKIFDSSTGAVLSIETQKDILNGVYGRARAKASITMTVSEAEYYAFKAHAESRGFTMSALLWETAKDAGLFKGLNQSGKPKTKRASKTGAANAHQNV